MTKALISVVIPVLNESPNLVRLVERLRPVLDGLDQDPAASVRQPDTAAEDAASASACASASASGDAIEAPTTCPSAICQAATSAPGASPRADLVTDWELVFIDDGSSDGTLATLRAIHLHEPRVRAIALSRNFGKEIALAAGLRYAEGDAVILMDADLQHPPEILPHFIRHWREGYQVVYGQRLDRNTDSALRRLLSVGYYKLFNALVKTDIPEGAGDFRLLDRKAVDAMNRIGEASRFNKGLYSWIGFKSIGVPYFVAERADGGGSRWNVRRLAHFALDGLTSFSTLPLRLSTLLGLAVSIVAFCYAMFIILETMLFGTRVPGFPSIMISVMFFAGVQLIFLGIIGEYLGRVYEEVKARPLFLVAEEIGMDHPRAGHEMSEALCPQPQSGVLSKGGRF